jgi:ankyrin repeat protein
LAKAIDEQPDTFLRNAGADGLTTLHSLALGGSAAGVRVLLEKGADRSAKTKNGKTALDLAEQMGWPRVIELLKSERR